MNMITSGLENCDGYIDDVIICNDTWIEHLVTIWKFFDRLPNAWLLIYLNVSSAVLVWLS